MPGTVPKVPPLRTPWRWLRRDLPRLTAGHLVAERAPRAPAAPRRTDQRERLRRLRHQHAPPRRRRARQHPFLPLGVGVDAEISPRIPAEPETLHEQGVEPVAVGPSPVRQDVEAALQFDGPVDDRLPTLTCSLGAQEVAQVGEGEDELEQLSRVEDSLAGISHGAAIAPEGGREKHRHGER